MYCGKCGKEIKENMAFCPWCGQKVMLDTHHSENIEKKDEPEKTPQ